MAKTWKVSELNIVKGAAKQRQAEDRARAEAWRKAREAELEAVINREYDGMEIPEMRTAVTEAREALAPFIAKFDRLAAEHYPAEFQRPTLSLSLRAGGILPDFRKDARRDGATHINAKYAYMLANAQTFVTEITTDASKRTTENEEVHEFLERLAAPNSTTPVLERPGPAIGILRKLLPNPDEWGFEGYRDDGSALLPRPPEQKAIAAPKEKGGK